MQDSSFALPMSLANEHKMSTNPYAIPTNPLPAETSEDKVRRAHIVRETSIKGLGGVWIFIGGLMIVVFIFFAFMATANSKGSVHQAPHKSVVIIPLYGLALVVTGIGLVKLKRWARIPACILAVLGAFISRIGMIIAIYALFNIFEKKADMVFSEHYKSVILATPQISPRRLPRWAVVGSVMVFLLIMAGIVGWKVKTSM